MKHFIPEKKKTKKVNGFIYSEKEDRLICRKGYSSIGKSRRDNGYLYYFSSDSCRNCSGAKECSLNKDRARVYVSENYLLQMKIDPEKKKEALEKCKRYRGQIWRNQKTSSNGPNTASRQIKMSHSGIYDLYGDELKENG